jgi:ABC-type antimicrobial peptide transport system permease subunit
MGLLVDGKWTDRWYDTRITGGRFVRQDSRANGQSTQSVLAQIRAQGLRINRVADAETALANTIQGRRLDTWLFGFLALSGVVVVSIGVFGVVAITTEQRTREIGVRVALGATPQRVVVLLLAQLLVAVVGGLAVGVSGAALLVGFARSSLDRVGVFNVTAWAFGVLAIAAIATASMLVPATRAARKNPAIALRARL